MVKSGDKFDEWLLKDNRWMAHQGMLDECKDYHVYEADLEQVQELLKLSIRPRADEDWECTCKYFGGIAARVVCNTYKHTTQHGVLPHSSHL